MIDPLRRTHPSTPIAADDGTGGSFSPVQPGDGDSARGWVVSVLEVG